MDTYFARLDFEVIPSDALTIARLLWEYAAVFDDQERHPRIARRVYSSLDKYSIALDSQNEFTFPELVEDYYANLVGGGYQEEYADSHLRKIYSEFPERRFQYWKSALGRSTGVVFYASTEGWIVPPETDLQSLLKSCAGAPSDVVFHEADLQLVDGKAYVANRDHITELPLASFSRALCCKVNAIKPDPYSENRFWSGFLWKTNETYFDSIRDTFIFPNPSNILFSIDDYGDVILAQADQYYYIFFGAHKLNQPEIIRLRDSLATAFELVDSISGLKGTLSCHWETLNDEQFERLCYDIIYYNPKFDNSTIRKMGKSRSRDGGRDIEVYTRAKSGHSPEKYIFQCKLVRGNKSLSGSKLTGISDILDQHGAQGYGIMTSGVIDATLYDKLDGIARNKITKVETWSVLELERFLSANPNIKGRYFKM